MSPFCPQNGTEWGQKGTTFLSPITLVFSVPHLIFYDCLPLITQKHLRSKWRGWAILNSLGAIHKNSGLLTLMNSVPNFYPQFLSPILSLCPQCSHWRQNWGQNGDRMGTEKCQWLWRLVGETFISNGFHAVNVFSAWQRARKAYVMPCIIFFVLWHHSCRSIHNGPLSC